VVPSVSQECITFISIGSVVHAPMKMRTDVPSKHLHSYTTQYPSRHKSFIKMVFACFMNKDNLKECLWNEKYTTLQKNCHKRYKRSRNVTRL